MCGIAGIINLRAEEKNYTEPLTRMTARIRHRGPDDEGYLLANQEGLCFFKGNDTPSIPNQSSLDIGYYPQADISNVDGLSFLAFGHRRLSILDLSYHGHQPMCDVSGLFWIIYNGEIYNFREVREVLLKEGFIFKSESDTEVILYAYRKWGEHCLKHFNGMFAFAIYDAKNRKVFLARDRIGIKPLYYTISGHDFLFASDIKTLIASGLYAPEINPEGLWHNLSFGVAPRPMTCFKNVYSLEQGYWMNISLKTGRIEKKSYWEIPVGAAEAKISEAEALELLESALVKSIKYQLISDVEVGTFMSGGIDSTTITAIASRLHPGIKAFTLGFDKSVSEFDELNEAKENARMNDLRHIVMMVGANDIIEFIDDFVLNQEEPYNSLHQDYIISKLVAKNGIKVILNGLGPDELFGGYRRFTRIDFWKRVQKLKWMLSLAPTGINPLLDKVKELSQMQTTGEFYSSIFSQFTERQKRQLFKAKNQFNSLTVIENQYKPSGSFSDVIESMCYYEMMNYIGNHHLYRGDQNTMRFSIEARFPFLDHHLVELAFRLPSKFKVKEGTGKYILRQVAKKYIAPGSLQMKKRGFGLPVGRWMNHELKPLVDSCKEKLKRRDLFNPAAVEKVFRQNDEINYSRAWHLVMTELWLEKFIDNPQLLER